MRGADRVRGTGPTDHRACAIAVKVAGEFSHRTVVDLTRVSLIDSTSLTILVEAQHHIAESDGTVALVGLSGNEHTAVTVTGLDHLFPIYAHLAAVTELTGHDTGTPGEGLDQAGVEVGKVLLHARPVVGGDCPGRVAVVRAQPEVFGPVASDHQGAQPRLGRGPTRRPRDKTLWALLDAARARRASHA